MANIQEILIKELGLKVGDYVKITHIVPSNDLGWKNAWVGEMDKYVGKVGKIVKIGIHGIDLKEDGESYNITYSFPAQVLQKTEAPVPEVKLNSSYTAKIYKTKVVVGCQEFKISVIRDIITKYDSVYSK
jgi:hypothetical protein